MRNLLLAAGLALAPHALAVGAAEAVAPLPVSAEEYGLVIYIAQDKKQDFSFTDACAADTDIQAAIRLLLDNDFAVFVGGDADESMIGEVGQLSPADRKEALQLEGFFVAPAKDVVEGNALVAGTMKLLDELKIKWKPLAGTDEAKAQTQRATALYEDLKAGRVTAPPEVIKTGCLLSGFITADKPNGLFVRAIPSYVAERLKEYRRYRSNEGYQSARWGMTAAEVARAEGLAGAASKAVKIDGHPARVSYHYTDGRLSSVRVRLQVTCLPAPCYERFLKISDVLASKYGTYSDNSTTDETTLERTSSRLYQSVSDESGLVGDGYRREIHTWALADTRIDHMLFSTRKPLDKTKGVIIEEIVYTSTRFEPRAQQLQSAAEEKAQKARQQNL